MSAGFFGFLCVMGEGAETLIVGKICVFYLLFIEV